MSEVLAVNRWKMQPVKKGHGYVDFVWEYAELDRPYTIQLTNEIEILVTHMKKKTLRVSNSDRTTEQRR